jgi:hypothetical protein
MVARLFIAFSACLVAASVATGFYFGAALGVASLLVWIAVLLAEGES